MCFDWERWKRRWSFDAGVVSGGVEPMDSSVAVVDGEGGFDASFAVD